MKTKSIYKKLLFAVAIFAFSQKANSQDIADAYAAFTEVNNTSTYNGVFHVELTDSVFSELEISLGSSQTATNDIVSYTYSYDITSGLPSNWSYQREGTKLTLEIGQYADHNIYFGSARVKGTNGQWSTNYNFICN